MVGSRVVRVGDNEIVRGLISSSLFLLLLLCFKVHPLHGTSLKNGSKPEGDRGQKKSAHRVRGEHDVVLEKFRLLFRLGRSCKRESVGGIWQ